MSWSIVIKHVVLLLIANYPHIALHFVGTTNVGTCPDPSSSLCEGSGSETMSVCILHVCLLGVFLDREGN